MQMKLLLCIDNKTYRFHDLKEALTYVSQESAFAACYIIACLPESPNWCLVVAHATDPNTGSCVRYYETAYFTFLLFDLVKQRCSKMA